MILAAMNGHLNIVTYLYENGSDINIKDNVSNYIILSIIYLLIKIY
jgi:ankyrin repeat protein